VLVVNMGRGLPKKYAKMGFVEGWKAYKASKTKRKLNKRRTTKTKVLGVKRMAKVNRTINWDYIYDDVLAEEKGRIGST